MLSGLGGQITTNNGKDCLMQLYLDIQDKAAPYITAFLQLYPLYNGYNCKNDV